ncbi:MAG: hypothetical protein HUU50_17840, partial [Candidatus Brocadiae bacterium]|nr:hypothetical protein [Candidatus Brocadiia bacterium]
ENTFEILHSIAYKMPKMPSDLLPSIPKALEAIILKSIEKNRRKRYPTAQAMAKDIEKYLSGQHTNLGYWKIKLRWKIQAYRKPLVKSFAFIMLFCLLLYSFLYYSYAKTQDSFQEKDITKFLKNYDFEKITEELKKDPSPSNYIKCIDLAFQESLYMESLHLCEEAFQAFHDSVFKEKKAELLFLLHRYQEAYKCYEELQREYPEKSWNIAFTQCAFALGEYAKAIEVLPKEDSKMKSEFQARYFFYRGVCNFMYFVRSIPYNEFLGSIQTGKWKEYPGSFVVQKAIEDLETAQKKVLLLKSFHDLKPAIDVYLSYLYVMQNKKVQSFQTKNQEDIAFYNTASIREELSGIFAFINKDYKKSLQHFEKCISWNPGSVSYPYFCLQSIYLINQNNTEESKQETQQNWEKILDYSMLCFELAPLNLAFLEILISDILENQTPDNFMYSMPFLFNNLGKISDKIHFSLWDQDFKKMAKDYTLHYDSAPGKIKNLKKILEKSLYTSSPQALKMAKIILSQHYNEKEIIFKEIQLLKQKNAQKTLDAQIDKNILEIQEEIEQKEKSEKQKNLKKKIAHLIVGMQSQEILEVIQDKPFFMEMLEKEKDTLLLYWIVQVFKKLKTRESYSFLQNAFHCLDFKIKMLCKIALHNSSFDIKIDFENKEFQQSFVSCDEKLMSLVFHHLGREIPCEISFKMLQESPKEKVKISASKAILCNPRSNAEQKAKALSVFFMGMQSLEKEIVNYCQWNFWYQDIPTFANPKDWEIPLGLLKHKDKEIKKIAAMSMNRFLEKKPSAEATNRIRMVLLDAIKSEPEELVRFSILVGLVELKEKEAILSQFFNSKESLKNRLFPTIKFIQNFLASRPEYNMSIENPFLAFDPFEKQETNPYLQCFYLMLLGKIIFPYFNILDGMPLNQERFIQNPLKKGFASESFFVRRTAAYIASDKIDNDCSIRSILKEQYYKETNSRVKKAIISTLVSYMDQDSWNPIRQKSKKALFGWIQTLEKQDKVASAHGYYHLFPKRYRYDLDTRYIKSASQWDRDQYYIKHLQSIFNSFCADYGVDTKIKEENIFESLQKEQYPNVYTFFQFYQNKNMPKEEFRKALILQRMVSAINSLARCTVLDMENSRYPFELSFFMELLGEQKNAMVGIDEAIRREPERKMYVLWKAILEYNAGNSDLALSMIHSLIHKNYRSELLWETKGKIHVARKEWQEAEGCFQELHAMYQEHPDPLLWIAQIKILQGEQNFSNIKTQYIEKALNLLKEEEKWLEQRMIADTRGKFLFRSHFKKLEGNYHFTLAVWAMAQKQKENAIQSLEKADHAFRWGFTNYCSLPVNKKNLSQFPGWQEIEKYPFTKNLPGEIQGLSTIENP